MKRLYPERHGRLPRRRRRFSDERPGIRHRRAIRSAVHHHHRRQRHVRHHPHAPGARISRPHLGDRIAQSGFSPLMRAPSAASASRSSAPRIFPRRSRRRRRPASPRSSGSRSIPKRSRRRRRSPKSAPNRWRRRAEEPTVNGRRERNRMPRIDATSGAQCMKAFSDCGLALAIAMTAVRPTPKAASKARSSAVRPAMSRSSRLLGAAAGCAIGHHEANKKDKDRAAAAAIDPVYSALMPAALMIGHHFSISAFWKACSASGVCCSGG